MHCSTMRSHCTAAAASSSPRSTDWNTADLDVLSVVPREDLRTLAEAARQGSALHKKHGVYLDVVTVATYPDEYESRLIEMPHRCAADLALTVSTLRSRALRPSGVQ